MRSRCFWLLLCLVFLTPVHAEVTQSADSIADRSVHRMQEALTTDPLNLPSEPQNGRDLLVLIRAGGGYVDIRALGKQTAPAKPIAEALEKALAGTALGEHVEYSAEDDYACAKAAVSAGRFGATAGSQDVPLGVLVEGLKAAGYVPHVLLSVPFYAAADAPRALPVSRRQQNTWYDATKSAPDLTVRVSAKMSPALPYLAALFVAFVPLVGGLGILAAAALAKNARIPVERRRTLYPRLAQWPAFGAMAIHAPFAVWFMVSGGTRPLSDLWFGSVSVASVFAPAMMFPLLLLFPVLAIAGKVERNLFGPATAESGEPAPTLASAMSPEEKAARMTVLRYSMIPLALGMLWIFFGNKLLGLKGSVASVSNLSGMTFAILGSRILRFVLDKRLLASFQSFPGEDIELTERASRLAERAGVTLSKVEIDESVPGRTQANAAYLPPGTVRVSRRALDVLTPEQLDFVLAHEVAHKQKAHVARQLALTLPVLVLMAVPMIFLQTGVSSSQLPRPILYLALVAPLLVFPFMMVAGGALKRARELEADRGALELTRDLPAAVSALAALQKNSPMPYLHDVEMLNSHPATARRIENLRRVAAQLGLKEEGEKK